jgi:hypothetical protein
VVAAPGNPPGEGDGVPCMLGAQRAGRVGAHHGKSLLDLSNGKPDPAEASRAKSAAAVGVPWS